MVTHIHFLNSSNHKEPISVKFHQHSCYEMVLYTQGHGFVEIGQERYEYQAGSVVFIYPNTLHSEINSEPSHNIFIGFYSDQDIMLQQGIYKSSPQVVSIFHSLLQEITEKKKDYDTMVSLLLQQILISLRRTSDKHNEQDNFLYIINYINENYSLPIKVEELAEISNYSYSRFRHIFKEIYGLSPKEYIMKTRLEKANQLLSIGKKNVTEIAYTCGFYDTSSFCKLYRKHFGRSPLHHNN